jgi:transposase, IS5 family
MEGLPLATMLQMHCLQQWYALSDLAMEEELYEIGPMRQFAGLSLARGTVPDETTILNFRHLLERRDWARGIFETVKAHLQAAGLLLRQGTIVDAAIIVAPSSRKDSTGERDPEMDQTKKGNQWCFGMKAHVGVDAESGLVRSMIGMAANVADVTKGHELLHGCETVAFGNAGYIGVDQRPERKRWIEWQVAMSPGQAAGATRYGHGPAARQDRTSQGAGPSPG